MATLALYKDKINGVGSAIGNIINVTGDLNAQLSTLKTTLQGVNSNTYDLQTAVNSISSSSKTEEQKVKELETLNTTITEFITTVVQKDEAAADAINEEKDDFYTEYSYLKPECEKSAWEKFKGTVASAGEWVREHYKLIITAIVVVVAIVLLCTGVGSGLGAAILAGACWGAIIGAVIGGVSGGIRGVMNGGSFWEGFENGSFDGAIGGMIGGGITGGLFFVLGPGVTLTSSIIQGAGVGSISSGISNMVVTTLDFFLEHGNLNGALDDIAASCFSGMISGAIFGGITGGYSHVKMQLKVSDQSFLKSNGDIDWDGYAPNGGRVPGTVKIDQTINKGTIIDRYGSKYGSYTSPAGTPFEQRALPYDNNSWAYHKYEVIKVIDGVTISEIAPAFNQPGGGIQFELPSCIKDLVKNGYL